MQSQPIDNKQISNCSSFMTIRSQRKIRKNKKFNNLKIFVHKPQTLNIEGILSKKTQKLARKPQKKRK